MVMQARLRKQYEEVVLPQLREELGRTNDLSLPKLTKIVVSMGVGKAAQQDRKAVEDAAGHLATITGQKPEVTKARKSVAGFKLREGMEVGCRVTLRGARMYEFLDRLISIVLPRVRDFRGLPSKGFDKAGNYNFGLNEQLVFPEIDPDNVRFLQGMNITIVTTTTDDAEAKLLLEKFSFPFTKPAAPKKKPT